MLMIPVGIMIK